MTTELSRLLTAERAVSPPAQAAEAGLERLLTALTSQAAPLPVAVGALKLGGALVPKWIGVGFAVGLAGAGAASQVWTTAAVGPVPSTVVAATDAPSAAPAKVAFQPAPSPLTSASTAPERPAPFPSAAPASTPDAAASTSLTFDEEVRLITRAKQELDAGRPHLAQVWLQEHQQRFPGGVFRLDREGLSILARCSQRPDPAAARDFAARYPGSPMVGQLQRKCGADGAPARKPTGDFSEPTNEVTGSGEPTHE